MTAGITVPEKAPLVLRALSNGTAAGAGLRIYVPSATVAELGLKPGRFFRARREADGRVRLTPVDAAIREVARTGGPAGAMPPDKMRIEVDVHEALAMEACLALGERTDPSLLRQLGKQIRKRMKTMGWPAPDRTDDVRAGAP